MARQASVSTVLPSSQVSVPARTKPSPQLAATQVTRHASVLIALPSSHASPASMTPLPHSAAMHELGHASVSMRLPSSQVSTPVRMKPSPQVAATQAPTQASVLIALPSSQASTPVRTKPSPQTASRHTLVQPSVLEVFMSSQVSTPARMKPSPQVAAAHVDRQASVLLALPSSQVSTPARTTPSPHVATTQVARQASVSIVLPSSQASTPARITPSPHAAATQVARQASVSTRLPSSQPSSPVIALSPQVAAGMVPLTRALLRGAGVRSAKSLALSSVSSAESRVVEPPATSSRRTSALPPGIAGADVPTAPAGVPEKLPHATQSTGMASKHTAPPAADSTGVIDRSAPRPKNVTACVVAIKILSWLAPLATEPGNVNVPTTVPVGPYTVMSWPPTMFWPLVHIWITTYCAPGEAAVPGNTSVTFIRWNAACAARGKANVNPTTMIASARRIMAAMVSAPRRGGLTHCGQAHALRVASHRAKLSSSAIGSSAACSAGVRAAPSSTS